MTTVAIVQARLDSDRLPGKVLERVGGRTILEWVLYRAAISDAPIDRLVVATSARTVDQPIANHCRQLGVDCYRSSARDVLNRYYRAAEYCQADTVVRVTADCPLLCPVLLDDVTLLLDSLPNCDYAGVNGAPNGLGQEAFTFGALELAWQEATMREDREHVVTYMEASRQFECCYIDPESALQERQHWRLTVDEPDDLDLLRRLYDATDGALFDLDSRAVLEAVEADAGMLALATRQT